VPTRIPSHHFPITHPVEDMRGGLRSPATRCLSPCGPRQNRPQCPCLLKCGFPIKMPHDLFENGQAIQLDCSVNFANFGILRTPQRHFALLRLCVRASALARRYERKKDRSRGLALSILTGQCAIEMASSRCPLKVMAATGNRDSRPTPASFATFFGSDL
jgi:hypothetical protein